MLRLPSASATLFLATIFLSASFSIPAHATVYDSNVVQKLDLTPAQRTKVRAIVAQGQKEFRAILRKHKINPNAKPDMQKLMSASSELLGYRQRQRQKIAPILTPEQLDKYDDIMEETSARVRRAAQ